MEEENEISVWSNDHCYCFSKECSFVALKFQKKGLETLEVEMRGLEGKAYTDSCEEDGK